MKRTRKFLALAVISALLCGCGQTEPAGTSNNAETSAELTVTTTEIAVSEEITTTTEVTTTPETTTNSETEETEETVIEKSAETTELTTVLAEKTIETTTETTTMAETTVTTTTATTTTTVTTAATTVTTTTPEITTTPKTKKTKKTKKTTTTPEETTTPETTEVTTTTEPPEIIPESGIYTAEDGTLYVDGCAYELTFEDEFEGDSLDFTKWEYCPEWQRQNVNCYWRNSAVSLDGQGKLCITTSYESGNYIAGGIRSKGKFEQAYGYFEVKCTLNTIPGYWSAFWLLCEEVMNENNSGVDGTEIDIMESAFFDTSQVNHALNWDGYGTAQKAVWYQTQKDGLYEGYHTFSLLWTEEEYVFYVDGAESYRTRAEEAGGVSTAPSYLKFTTETGLWTIDSLDNSKLPDNVYVDYIRVYSKSE